MFIAIYRSPSSTLESFIDHLDQCLSFLFSKFGHSSFYILGGDLNINFLANNIDSKLLFDVLGSYGFALGYDSATRVQGMCASGIDYLITNVPLIYHNSQVVHSNISDHYHQTLAVDKCYLGLSLVKVNGNINKRIFSNQNILEFKSHLIELLNRGGCVYNHFLDCFYQHFPLKSVKIMPKKINSSDSSPYLVNFSEFLRNMHDDLKSNNLPLSQEYKDLLNKFKICVAQNRIASNSIMINQSRNTIKSSWTLINSKIKKHTVQENIKLMINNSIECDGEKIANCFIDTFLPENLNSNSIPPFNDNPTPPVNQMVLFPTDPAEVKSIILSLPNSSSVGPDEIPTSLIKSCVDIICEPMSDLINDIFATGTFPDDFKLAKIIPLFKKGSKYEPQNYRPLVIQNIFSKIVDKIFTKRLVSFLVKYKLINSCQYAYLKGKSVDLAIYNFLNAIYDSLENSNDCIGVFYDFSKAFDMVCLIILYRKLSALGVNGAPLAFIKSYLCNRRYFVQLRQTDAAGNVVVHKSRERTWNRGVPQGSNLGPYLFLVMINDLPAHLQSNLLSMFSDLGSFTLSLYADDVNKIVSHKVFARLEAICNYSIGLIHDWCKVNDLKLNIDKTNFIQFQSVHNRFVNPKPDLSLGNSSVVDTENCVFLGLRLNKNLDWNNHIDHLSCKLRSGCFALGRLRDEIDFNTLKSVYYAHIYSHIKNNIIFWGHCSSSNRIFVLQKRAIRTIFRVPARHSCVSLFSKFGVLTVPSIYIYECAIFVKKNLALFKKNCDTHCYATRNCNMLSVFQHSKSSFEKCPKYRMVHVYNRLPACIRDITSISIFKKKLFNYLLGLNLYSVRDLL